jgi:5,10-methenyltetrahydromethanopterin hydrogenase
LDKKTKEPKTIPDPKWILFEKCMRGDSSDNIFSAFPGVRTKGSKNKVGLTEAYADKESKGFAWNNLMLQRWTDHNGEEHKVLDDYHRNVVLVDLSAQPEDIKVKIAETIATNAVPLQRPMVGIHFMKFCGKYDLVKMSERASDFNDFLGASYPESAVTWRVMNE